ncbi:MAG: alkane 1-monooxygenase [Planctomycetota bacterium]
MKASLFSSTALLRIKKYGYLFFLGVPSLMLVSSYYLGNYWRAGNFFNFFTLAFTFGFIPLLDYLFGKDPFNPSDQDEVLGLTKQPYYSWLTLASVPILLGILLTGGVVFMDGNFNLAGKIGWILSVGVVSSLLGINVSHELIHKTSRIEQWSGGVLLSMVIYGGFKVEHIRGHHVYVATPEDPSSAQYNESLYHFLPSAYYRNFRNAWQFEFDRLKRQGKNRFHWSNELLWWYGLSVFWIVLFTFLFGKLGAIYFIGQSIVAFTLLEIVNYLEHYGLSRRLLENGRYETPTIFHSWNAHYLVTNLLLLELPRHSDHHTAPRKRYQVLHQFEGSPEFPAGYPTMVLLALVPPLWRKIMNPRVEHYQKTHELQAV